MFPKLHTFQNLRQHTDVAGVTTHVRIMLYSKEQEQQMKLIAEMGRKAAARFMQLMQEAEVI